MEIILWRHADAEDGADDMARRLTAKGGKQAQAMAKWLRARLPEKFTLVASPALRAQQTAAALNCAIETEHSLAPGASAASIARAAGKRKGLVIVVGHQPDLGRAAAQLLGMKGECRIEKGALWWLEDDKVRAVMSPDLL
jgi:phosphohistidine phosphatase